MPLEKQEKEFVSENHNQEPETAIDLAWDVRCRMKHFYTVKPCGESSRGKTISSYGNLDTCITVVGSI